MIQSGGVLKKGYQATVWEGTPATWPDWLTDQWSSYGAIYRRQLWVAVLVNKIANATARLPLKVYQRDDSGRTEVRDHPYSRLLRQPNHNHDPFLFWLWTVSTLNVYGEAFWGKIRDPGGRPVELVPLHPASVRSEVKDGRVQWSYDNGSTRFASIARRDLVHFRFYNPDSLMRGMSPLEPLRSTLENEDGARRANSALWRNGGRPSVFLKHPKTLSDGAAKRIAASWNEVHGGVDNWARAAVLEEGMEAETIALNAEELQYIESRRLNREEACAAFDVPPPVVHILDRATFSNITEQMRSMYRDTMAPKLGLLESTLETELRDGSFGQGEPDFGEDVYAEFLLDQVLRGDFEVRVNAWATAIQTGQVTQAEARQAENRPFIEGTDRLLVNAALVPTDTVDRFDGLDRVNALGQLVRAGFEPSPSAEAVGLPSIPHTGLTPVTVRSDPMDPATLRTVMGRLSRQKHLAEVDAAALTAGLNGHSEAVLAALEQAKNDGLSVAEFRELLARPDR